MAASDIEQLRRDIAEAEALFDQAFSKAEARRDMGWRVVRRARR